MNNNFFFISCKLLCLLVFLVIFDVSTKCWVRKNFLIEEVIYIAPGINFCYINNTGLAFGLFSSTKIHHQWILICIIVFIIILFFVGLYKAITSNMLYDSIAYTVIVGGALGNLYDRILYGSVVDFIDLHIGIWHWPIFNVADIGIFIGMLFFIMHRIIFVKIEL